jgi:peptide/nickel transport system permease protein
MGAPPRHVVLRHILPNALGTIVVNASFQVADAILYVAYLSFLGLGIPPPAVSWGSMLSQGVNYLFQGYWWLIWPAGLFIVLLSVSFSVLGDGLRDALDPRLLRR